jgi:hypothetical protein
MIYILFYSFFINAGSSSDYIQSHSRTISEWRIGKDMEEVVIGLIWGSVQASVYGRLKETSKNLCQDSQCPDLEMNQAPPDYK